MPTPRAERPLFKISRRRRCRDVAKRTWTVIATEASATPGRVMCEATSRAEAEAALSELLAGPGLIPMDRVISAGGLYGTVQSVIVPKVMYRVKWDSGFESRVRAERLVAVHAELPVIDAPAVVRELFAVSA